MSGMPRVPVGTQVVLRETGGADGGAGTVQRGATGRVVADDGVRYTVRLGDGRTVTADRNQLALRKQHQAGVALPADAGDGHRLVRDHTVLAAVVGSRAFGLDTDDSDTDTRGIFQVPTPAF
jgi:hypothetical protein